MRSSAALMLWRRITVPVSICLLIPQAVTCLASDIVWTNTAGGDWNTASNWNPNQVPGPFDNAQITNNGSYTATVTIGSTVANVAIGAPVGSQTLRLSGGTLALTGTANMGSNSSMMLAGGALQ